METVNTLCKTETQTPIDLNNCTMMLIYMNTQDEILISNGVDKSYRILIPDQILATQLKPPDPVQIANDVTVTMPIVWEQLYEVNKASICAITLPTPTVNDNGKIMRFLFKTNYAHYIKTPSGLKFNGSTTHVRATIAVGTAPAKNMITVRVLSGSYWIFGAETTVTFATS